MIERDGKAPAAKAEVDINFTWLDLFYLRQLVLLFSRARRSAGARKGKKSLEQIAHEALNVALGRTNDFRIQADARAIKLEIPENLAEIVETIGTGTINFQYKSASSSDSDAATNQTVRLHRIIKHRTGLYLYGEPVSAEGKKEIRAYKFQRIEGNITPKAGDPYDVETKDLGLFPEKKLETAMVALRPGKGQLLRRWSTGVAINPAELPEGLELPEGWEIWEFKNLHSYTLVMELVELGGDARVISPGSLVNEVRATAEKLANFSGKSVDKKEKYQVPKTTPDHSFDNPGSSADLLSTLIYSLKEDTTLQELTEKLLRIEHPDRDIEADVKEINDCCEHKDNPDCESISEDNKVYQQMQKIHKILFDRQEQMLRDQNKGDLDPSALNGWPALESEEFWDAVNKPIDEPFAEDFSDEPNLLKSRIRLTNPPQNPDALEKWPQGSEALTIVLGLRLLQAYLPDLPGLENAQIGLQELIKKTEHLWKRELSPEELARLSQELDLRFRVEPAEDYTLLRKLTAYLPRPVKDPTDAIVTQFDYVDYGDEIRQVRILVKDIFFEHGWWQLTGFDPVHKEPVICQVSRIVPETVGSIHLGDLSTQNSIDYATDCPNNLGDKMTRKSPEVPTCTLEVERAAKAVMESVTVLEPENTKESLIFTVQAPSIEWLVTVAGWAGTNLRSVSAPADYLEAIRERGRAILAQYQN